MPLGNSMSPVQYLPLISTNKVRFIILEALLSQKLLASNALVTRYISVARGRVLIFLPDTLKLQEIDGVR